MASASWSRLDDLLEDVEGTSASIAPLFYPLHPGYQFTNRAQMQIPRDKEAPFFHSRQLQDESQCAEVLVAARAQAEAARLRLPPPTRRIED